MQTYSMNALAEMFERDRSTIVKALRNVPPDAEKTKGRPTFKLSTASTALAKHMASNGLPGGVNNSSGGNGNGAIVDNDSTGNAEFDQANAALDQAIKKMEALPTLAARRKAALGIAPLIEAADRLMRSVGRPNHQAADILRMMYARGFEKPCDWSFDQALAAMSETTEVCE